MPLPAPVDLEWHEQIARRIEASRNRPLRIRDLIGAIVVSAVLLGLGRSAFRTYEGSASRSPSSLAVWLALFASVGVAAILGIGAAILLGRVSTSLYRWGKDRSGLIRSIRAGHRHTRGPDRIWYVDGARAGSHTLPRDVLADDSRRIHLTSEASNGRAVEATLEALASDRHGPGFRLALRRDPVAGSRFGRTPDRDRDRLDRRDCLRSFNFPRGQAWNAPDSQRHGSGA